MKNVVIFDCNGIFMKSEKGFIQNFCEYFDMAQEVVLPIYMEIMNNVRRPDAPNIYDLWKPFFDEWGIEMTEEQLYEFWFGPEIIQNDMIDVLQEIVDQENLGIILSNNFRERYEYKKDFFDKLNAIASSTYYSWNTGFVKPHHDTFNLVLATNNIEASQCVFFDDSPINVAAADEIGMSAHLFTNAEDCIKILQQEGILN